MRALLRIPLLANLLVLAGCYESQTDLLGDEKATITLADSVFGYNGVVVHFEGAGETIKACTPHSKTEMLTGCVQAAEVSLGRTIMGNYIIQKSKPGGGYQYGMWYRSYTGDRGGAGRQCIEWIGTGIIGESLKMEGPLPRRYSDFASRVLAVAPTKDIDVFQLRALAAAYEIRFQADETCLGTWALIDPETIVIEGDRRHLRAFD